MQLMKFIAEFFHCEVSNFVLVSKKTARSDSGRFCMDALFYF